MSRSPSKSIFNHNIEGFSESNGVNESNNSQSHPSFLSSPFHNRNNTRTNHNSSSPFGPISQSSSSISSSTMSPSSSLYHSHDTMNMSVNPNNSTPSLPLPLSLPLPITITQSQPQAQSSSLPVPLPLPLSLPVSSLSGSGPSHSHSHSLSLSLSGPITQPSMLSLSLPLSFDETNDHFPLHNYQLNHKNNNTPNHSSIGLGLFDSNLNLQNGHGGSSHSHYFPKDIFNDNPSGLTSSSLLNPHHSVFPFTHDNHSFHEDFEKQKEKENPLPITLSTPPSLKRDTLQSIDPEEDEDDHNDNHNNEALQKEIVPNEHQKKDESRPPQIQNSHDHDQTPQNHQNENETEKETERDTEREKHSGGDQKQKEGLILKGIRRGTGRNIQTENRVEDNINININIHDEAIEASGLSEETMNHFESFQKLNQTETEKNKTFTNTNRFRHKTNSSLHLSGHLFKNNQNLNHIDEESQLLISNSDSLLNSFYQQVPPASSQASTSLPLNLIDYHSNFPSKYGPEGDQDNFVESHDNKFFFHSSQTRFEQNKINNQGSITTKTDLYINDHDQSNNRKNYYQNHNRVSKRTRYSKADEEDNEYEYEEEASATDDHHNHYEEGVITSSSLEPREEIIDHPFILPNLDRPQSLPLLDKSQETPSNEQEDSNAKMNKNNKVGNSSSVPNKSRRNSQTGLASNSAGQVIKPQIASAPSQSRYLLADRERRARLSRAIDQLRDIMKIKKGDAAFVVQQCADRMREINLEQLSIKSKSTSSSRNTKVLNNPQVNNQGGLVSIHPIKSDNNGNGSESNISGNIHPNVHVNTVPAPSPVLLTNPSSSNPSTSVSSNPSNPPSSKKSALLRISRITIPENQVLNTQTNIARGFVDKFEENIMDPGNFHSSMNNGNFSFIRNRPTESIPSTRNTSSLSFYSTTSTTTFNQHVIPSLFSSSNRSVSVPIQLSPGSAAPGPGPFIPSFQFNQTFASHTNQSNYPEPLYSRLSSNGNTNSYSSLSSPSSSDYNPSPSPLHNHDSSRSPLGGLNNRNIQGSSSNHNQTEPSSPISHCTCTRFYYHLSPSLNVSTFPRILAASPTIHNPQSPTYPIRKPSLSQYLREMLSKDTSLYIICISRQDQSILFLSEMMENVLGYNIKSEVVGKDWRYEPLYRELSFVPSTDYILKFSQGELMNDHTKLNSFQSLREIDPTSPTALTLSYIYYGLHRHKSSTNNKNNINYNSFGQDSSPVHEGSKDLKQNIVVKKLTEVEESEFEVMGYTPPVPFAAQRVIPSNHLLTFAPTRCLNINHQHSSINHRFPHPEAQSSEGKVHKDPSNPSLLLLENSILTKMDEFNIHCTDAIPLIMRFHTKKGRIREMLSYRILVKEHFRNPNDTTIISKDKNTEDKNKCTTNDQTGDKSKLISEVNRSVRTSSSASAAGSGSDPNSTPTHASASVPAVPGPGPSVEALSMPVSMGYEIIWGRLIDSRDIPI